MSAAKSNDRKEEARRAAKEAAARLVKDAESRLLQHTQKDVPQIKEPVVTLRPDDCSAADVSIRPKSQTEQPAKSSNPVRWLGAGLVVVGGLLAAAGVVGVGIAVAAVGVVILAVAMYGAMSSRT